MVLPTVLPSLPAPCVTCGVPQLASSSATIVKVGTVRTLALRDAVAARQRLFVRSAGQQHVLGARLLSATAAVFLQMNVPAVVAACVVKMNVVPLASLVAV